jgi:hypothetical protein
VGLKYRQRGSRAGEAVFQTYPRGVEVEGRAAGGRPFPRFRRTLVGLKPLGSQTVKTRRVAFQTYPRGVEAKQTEH